MMGPSCQRYNWQTGWCGSMAFGSSPRRGKTLISNPAVLRKYPLVENTSGDNLDDKSGVEHNPCGVHEQAGHDKLGLRQDITTIH